MTASPKTTPLIESYRVMTDHASWTLRDGRWARTMMTPAGRLWTATTGTRGPISFQAAGDESGNNPPVDVFVLPSGAAGQVPELARALHTFGPVARIRNIDLWDALLTAVIRQVIQAAQAKRLYRALSEAHGRRLADGHTRTPLSPSPHTVLDLTDAQVSALGLKFHGPALRHAATAYLDRHQQWQELPPSDLIDALRSVTRIGPWTARAAVADHTNDFAFYPYDDLAVRTWARRAAPGYDWPADPRAFARLWQQLGGAYLSELTLLTLAWGHHHATPDT